MIIFYMKSKEEPYSAVRVGHNDKEDIDLFYQRGYTFIESMNDISWWMVPGYAMEIEDMSTEEFFEPCM